jgi:hypothetical protein
MPPPKSQPPPRGETLEESYKQETTLMQLRYFINRFKEFYSKSQKFEKELAEADKLLSAKQTDQAAGVLEVLS